MLQRVDTAPRLFSEYEALLPDALRAEILELAAGMRGMRVIHVNATPDGGGVAEILRTLVPVSRDLGIDAEWYVLPPDDAFFDVTKRMHNWLQGHSGRFLARHQRAYTGYLEQLAKQTTQLNADVWMIHDPQPLPLRSMVPLHGRAIWRCHIDCSAPNPRVCRYVTPWVQAYERVVFSMPEYVMPGVRPEQVEVVPPAIDPLAPKNRALGWGEARAVLTELGIDPGRPLVTQVSRFDPWKNPWQSVDAYRLARRALPGLQLAMVGVFAAKDDPEAPGVFESVRRYAGDDPDIHLFRDPAQVAQREVNAFQSGSEVVLQRSTREGFGLVVTEAMWKGTPVVGTPVGGIKLQIEDGVNGYLAESAEECAERIVVLVTDPALRAALGTQARETVRQRFLTPRLLRDHLLLYERPTAALAA